MKRALVAAVAAALVAAACSDDDVTVPVRAAPASRHDALVDQLRTDARAFAFQNGDWLEDEEDAPNFAVAWLANRAKNGELDADESSRLAAAKTRALAVLADGAPLTLEKIETAQGLAASGDASVRAALDAYVDRLDAAIHATGDFVTADLSADAEATRLGPTALTAMIATLEADLTLFGGEDRQARVLAIDVALRNVALTDLTDGETGAQARAYAYSGSEPGIYETSNIAMLIEKARVYRLTKDPSYQLEARAIYAALQTLKLSDAPATYSSPSGRVPLGTESSNLVLLSSQADLAFALTLMFEITGEERFIDEADSAFDEIETLRGPWCSPVTTECATGLVHHELDGKLATTLCSGCTFRVLYALGYRRALANQAF